MNKPRPNPRLRELTDDFGSRVRYRLCTRCRCWLPETEHFGVSQYGAGGVVLRHESRCRPCQAIVARERYQASKRKPRRNRVKSCRLIVDDFGVRVLYRRCSICFSWLPETTVHFVPRIRDPRTRAVVRYDNFCRDCRRDRRRAEYHRLPLKERRKLWEGRFEQIKADPERNERRRQEAREAATRWRKKHPEHHARLKREQWKRIKADPERHRRQKEARRLQYRLRVARERGIDPTELRLVTVAQPEYPDMRRKVPARALGLAVVAFAQRNDITLEDIGALCDVPARRVRAWVDEGPHGQQEAHLSTADRVLTNLELNWHEVWLPELPGYEEARLVFENIPRTPRRAA